MSKHADKNYMVVLEGLNAYVNGASNSEEQLIEDWLDKENTEEDVDCDVFPGVIEDEDVEEDDDDISPTYRAKSTKFAKRNSRYSSNTNRKRKASDKENNEARKSPVEDSSSDESQEEEIQPQRLVVPRNLPKIPEPLNESPPQKRSKEEHASDVWLI